MCGELFWDAPGQERREHQSARDSRYQDMCPQVAESHWGWFLASLGEIWSRDQPGKPGSLKLWRWETSRHSGDPVPEDARPRLDVHELVHEVKGQTSHKRDTPHAKGRGSSIDCLTREKEKGRGCAPVSPGKGLEAPGS